MPAASPIRAGVSSPDEGFGVPPWCGDGDYLAHFDALADRVRQAPEAGALEALHRLLVHVPASLTVGERVGLYRALWRCAGQLDAAALAAAAREFDGAFDPCIALLARPLDAAAALDLARAHLDGDAPFACDPAFARAWLADQALTESDADDAWLVRQRAAVTDARWGSAAGDAWLAPARRRCADIARRAPALAREACRLELELALAEGDDEAAVQALARCVTAQAHARLPFALLQRWLEGASPWPLALTAALQAAWLRPDLLHTPRYRAQLAGTVQRPALRMRVEALRRSLGDEADAPVITSAQGSVLYAVAVLDRTYGLAEQGQPIADAAAPLLRGKVLGTAARAALQRRCAIEAIDRIDPHAAALALADARRAAGDPQDALLLQQLLTAIDATAARQAADAAGLPPDGAWFDGDPAHEERLWQALAAQPHPHLQPLARHQLAMLLTQGSLAPTTGPKRHDLQQAQEAWRALRDHPAYSAQAQARLADGPWRLMCAAESREGGRQHLWVPCQQPDAQQVLIVFACVESHHRYAQLAGLAGLMPGHHLLFVNNPELNWYGDAVFDEVVHLIEQRVLGRFARENVTCYFGSMGGHAALKFALHFGFQSIAFNPQVDLRLWAAFRPQQRALLLGAREHANVQDAPLAQFERSPACYFCGSSVADREAFRVWLQRVQAARAGTYIIEKFDDADHAGLIGRIVPTAQVPALLHRTQARLRELASHSAAPATHAEVPLPLVASFWRRLAQASAIRLEVLVRDGRVFVADSAATGTVSAAVL